MRVSIAPVLALFCAATASAEPNDLIPDGGFVIAGTYHAGGDSRVQTGWTDTAKPIYSNRWDEGFGIRGLGLTWDVGQGQVFASGYRQSIPGGGNGYTLGYSTTALIAYGGLSAHGIAQLNWYPEEPTDQLKETNGWFPSFGAQIRYTHDSGAGLYVNAYPDLAGVKSFDMLYAFGGFVEW